jgi:AraC-like DNA-binding protein
MSTSRLSHLFKDEVGINVKNYRVDCRLHVAAAMLGSTSTPIKEIAYTAGYRHSLLSYEGMASGVAARANKQQEALTQSN